VSLIKSLSELSLFGTVNMMMQPEVIADRYKILRVLGEGGGGSIYLAKDMRGNSLLALKLFSSAASDTESTLRNEFDLLARLNHPNLVRVSDCGYDSKAGRHFLVQDYFDGRTLRQELGALSFAEVLRVTVELCRTLQYLHLQGVSHGDLKPENILYKQGSVKLIDFGLARTAGDLDATGTVSGTFPYIAPELFLGEPSNSRSDLYSLGAIIYEMVSGQPPFAAKTVSELIEKHLFENPFSPVAPNSEFPPEFGFLILKLLSKDPVDRFEEANDVIRSINLELKQEFELGPSRIEFPPEKQEFLKKKRVDVINERAIQYYSGKSDPESKRILAELYYRQGAWKEAAALIEGMNQPKALLLDLRIRLKQGDFLFVKNRGVELLKSLLDAGDQAAVRNLLGTALYYLGEYDASEASIRVALDVFEKMKDLRSQASVLNNLGNLRMKRGQWDEAMGLYEKSVALSNKQGDLVNEGLFRSSIGYAYHLKGRYSEALAFYRQSEALLDAIGFRSGAAEVKSNLANVFIAMGSLDSAEVKLSEFTRIAEEKNDRLLIAYSRLLMGDLNRRRDNKSQALENYQKAKELFEQLKSAHEVSIADKNIGELMQSIQESTYSVPIRAKERPQLGEDFVNRLLSINRKISLLHDAEKILDAILDAMIEFAEAERGHLILQEGGKSSVKRTRVLDSSMALSTKSEISNTLVERVFRTGEPIVTIDAAEDDRFSQAVSVQRLKLRSLLCLPLRIRDEVVGAIYMDNRFHRGSFQPSMLQLMQAFADQAVIALTNAKTMRELQNKSEAIEVLNGKLQDTLAEREQELTEVKQAYAVQKASMSLKYKYENIVGRSPAMVELLKTMDRTTEAETSVFILGEKGVGKELVARTIHNNGPRRKSAFVCVDCMTIPADKLEEEFFGRVNGGLFEAADGGTLFIENIETLPIAFQTKLLRVLSDGSVRRVDSREQRLVNVRLISSSHKDLKTAVREKKFREDLFYKVHGVRLIIPSLRERKEDLPLLIEHFLDLWAERNKKHNKAISRRAFEVLATYSWPGNVSELENTITNACIVCEDSKILPDDLRQKSELFSNESKFILSAPEDQSLKDALISFEKGIIKRALEETDGNISEASRKLKTARPHLSRLIKLYRLKGK